MNDTIYIVSALSREKIRNKANELKKRIKHPHPYVPIVEILEFILPTIWPDFELQICSNDELGEAHGITYPDLKIIKIREDIYDNACRGKGRDRFTFAHELGHACLHINSSISRVSDNQLSSSFVPRYVDSECQADCFAGEFLISSSHISICRSIEEIKNTFGVSENAARMQCLANNFEILSNGKIIKK